ncbi:MAG: hypothetical protein ACK401_06675 [Archaeoglobaceae archaeon]
MGMDFMRRFDWRKFKKKGLKKVLSKDEKVLEERMKEIVAETKSKGSIKDVSKEVLAEE